MYRHLRMGFRLNLDHFHIFDDAESSSMEYPLAEFSFRKTNTYTLTYPYTLTYLKPLLK